MLCLVPEELHSEKGSKAAETHGKQKQGLLGDPPASSFRLRFICSVEYKSYDGHYCVKHKKYFHVYIIIDAMSFSNGITKAFNRAAVLTLCLAVCVFAVSCSDLSDYEEDESTGTTASYSGEALPSSDTGGEETYPDESGSGYNLISKAYIYSAWYDIEKDNPANYSSIDTNDAYALKCVFYFNEPVTGSLRAVLLKNGGELASKQIKLAGKVIAECDFSAGLAGMGTFEPGSYTIRIESEGKSVAVSGEMRVK